MNNPENENFSLSLNEFEEQFFIEYLKTHEKEGKESMRRAVFQTLPFLRIIISQYEAKNAEPIVLKANVTLHSKEVFRSIFQLVTDNKIDLNEINSTSISICYLIWKHQKRGTKIRGLKANILDSHFKYVPEFLEGVSSDF